LDFPDSRSIPDDDRWMTLKEIGDEFKANSETVRLWITSGELSAARAGRKWIVRRSEILRFIRSRTGSGTPVGDLETVAHTSGLGADGRPPAPGTRLTANAPGVVERIGG
jgi:excisionase family DNA binding protein